MRKFLIYISSAILPVITACSDNLRGLPAVDEDSKVYIAAQISQRPQTRTPYVPVDDDNTYPDAPTYADPLYAAVWASSTPYQFIDGNKPGSETDTYVAMHTKATFQNRGPQLLSDIIYSKSGQSIYFVAFAPQTGWNCSADGKKAWYTFDGSEDVLFSHQIEGKYGNRDDAGNLIWPVLRFHHILTWLRFEIISENDEVSRTWGKILGISISGKVTAEIDLSSAYDEGVPDANISFTGDATDLQLYRKDTDTPFPGSAGYEIPFAEAEEAAYVLCAPVTAYEANPEKVTEPIEEYILSIRTENRTVEVPVDLKISDTGYFSGTTMGKQFTIRLIFKMGDNITVAAKLDDWQNGGIIEGTFDEI